MDDKRQTARTLDPMTEETTNILVARPEELETGVDVVDQQHFRYFELVNEYLEHAAEYTNTQDATERLVRSFEFMRDYVEEHFKAEESIMQEMNYPDYPAHRAEHEYFRSHIRSLRKRLEEDGFSGALAREVNFYVVEWFIHHILSVDNKLTSYLEQQKVKPDPGRHTI